MAARCFLSPRKSPPSRAAFATAAGGIASSAANRDLPSPLRQNSRFAYEVALKWLTRQGCLRGLLLCDPKRLGIRLDHDADARIQRRRHAAQHAEGMAFVARRLEAADLLLGGLEEVGKLPLESPACSRRAAICRATSHASPARLKRGKGGVGELLLQIAIEVGLFHFISIWFTRRREDAKS